MRDIWGAYSSDPKKNLVIGTIFNAVAVIIPTVVLSHWLPTKPSFGELMAVGSFLLTVSGTAGSIGYYYTRNGIKQIKSKASLG
jgi:hypothetical protein